MTSDTNPEYFTPQDAASFCGCSTATVKRIADELRLPVIRTVGGVRLFSREQVERIKAERERRAAEALRR
ncbi:MAG: helix-turn-helix domain-containing protein [Verrucomicrobiia bacterium]